jgi:O-antigen/teichoic acid export membrane protein
MSLLVSVVIGSIGTLLIYLFGGEVAGFLNLRHYESELKLTILATATSGVMMVFLYFHYGLRRNNFQNFLQLLRSSLWVVISIAVSLFLVLTLEQLILVINLSMCCIILVAFPWNDLNVLLPLRFSKEAFLQLARYCIPLLPYFAGVWGIPLIVRSQLNIYGGAKDVAIFSVAYTLMEIVFMFVSTISNTLTPYFFSEIKDETKPAFFYNLMLKYSIVTIVLIIPFIFILRYDIILLVASPEYRVSGNYIPLLIFFPLVRVLVIVFEQYYLKVYKTFFLGVVYTLSILLCIGLTVILIPSYSIYGAIFSSLISYAFIAIVLGIKQKDLLDLAYLNFRILGILVLILWGSVFVLSFLDIDNIYKIILLGISALLALILLPVFNEQERQRIAKLLRFSKS